MEKYNCYIIYIKERKVKDKVKYEFMNYEVYNDISKELACYYAIKHKCRICGFKGNERCEPLLADYVIGYHKWCNDITICKIEPLHDEEYINSISEVTIYPHHNHISFTISKKRIFQEQVEKIIKFNELKEFEDYSIEAFKIWAPNNLIPKGYKHITSGEIEEGDYYFDSHSFTDSPDTWLSVNVSFSFYKLGKKIEIQGIKYNGGRNGNGIDEITHYYEPFVIRKIN